MADLIPQQMLPMARFRYPNTWKATAVSGASPQADQVVATGVASKHIVVGYLMISNLSEAAVGITINWESGTTFARLTIPGGGVTLMNFIGIEPVSVTADKDLHADFTSASAINAEMTCGYFEVPEVT